MRTSSRCLIPTLLTLAVFVVGPLGAQDPSLEDNSCVMCHGTADIWDEDTKHLHIKADDLVNDIHWQKGIRCQDCHGGNAETFALREAHAIEDGFRKVESPADVPKFCGHCHSNKEYMETFNTEAAVDQEEKFWGSVHGVHLKNTDFGQAEAEGPPAAADDLQAATCISCHPRHMTRSVDDPKSAVHASLLTRTCGACHESQGDALLVDVHRQAGDKNARGQGTALACSECHGQEIHALRPVDDMASPVFVNHQVQSCGRCHEEALQDYRVSVHGQGLERSGLLSTAVCSSCHGAHGIFPAAEERSTLHATRVAGTCAQCHRFIEERLKKSVHGSGNGPGGATDEAAPGGEIKRKPSCSDCHQGHDLPNPRSLAFRNQQRDRCGNCHEELSDQYAQSMHGELSDLGYGAGAKCSDCHGAHSILPVSDPLSPMSSTNRHETCAKCHPGLPVNLASFDPHADHRNRAKWPVLFWVHRGFLTFLFTVIGIFAVHSVFWFVRSLIDVRKHGRPRGLVPGETAYVRFSPFHRVAHTIMVVSFLGLALTGLPLKYSSYDWAQSLAAFLGGFESTGLWHRIFSLTTFGCFFTYMTLLANRFLKGRRSGTPWKALLFGPESPLPNLRDARDFGGMLRWVTGRGPRPTFERWAYWEKVDFWGACSDIILIGSTGLILWFPNLFCLFLPGESLNVAKVIHSTLALLATGFVFAIHFFSTHFRPDKFPMDMSVLTGLVSEDEMRHERPDYLERLREEGKLDALRSVGPSRPRLWATGLAGLLALVVGLSLLAGIIFAMFAG